MKWLGMNTGLRYKKQQITKGDKKMKARIFEKNGLPNPLGMIMIILVIGLVCLIQCVLIQPVHAQKMADDINYIGIETWMFDEASWVNSESSNYAVSEEQDECSEDPETGSECY